MLACLDRSTSMRRYRKYALVAELYAQAVQLLAQSVPGAVVETWWFAGEVSCYATLAPAASAPVPHALEFRSALQGGSAIADSVVRLLERAEELGHERGRSPTKVALWTDGWDRYSRLTPRAAREAMRASDWVEVYLIGFVDESIRHRLDTFVSELGLSPERVFVYAHEDDPSDTERAAQDSSQAFSETITRWR